MKDHTPFLLLLPAAVVVVVVEEEEEEGRLRGGLGRGVSSSNMTVGGFGADGDRWRFPNISRILLLLVIPATLRIY